MRNPNKVFGAHDKIIWSIEKIDYAHRQVETSYRKKVRKIPEKFVEVD
jgi:hypothetical protein